MTVRRPSHGSKHRSSVPIRTSNRFFPLNDALINDVRLRQSEITKYNVKEVCELASAMSDTVICSGPLPVYRGDEIHSRLLSLNGWMFKWCPQNKIGFIDNWTSFWCRPDLLLRDGLHPSWGGAALLSRNMAHYLRVRT